MASGGAIDQILSSAVESLYEDERLRSALTDDEASILLGWAQAQLEEAARSMRVRQADSETGELFQEYARQVKRAARAVNDLVEERADLGDGSFTVRLLSIFSPSGAMTRALPPETRDLTARRNTMDNAEFIRRLTTLISESWRMAGGSGEREPGARPRRRTFRRASGGDGLGSSPLLLLGAIIVIGLLVVVAIFYFMRQPQPPAAPPQTTPGAGWYQVHFTSPRYPDNPADRRGGLDERLTAFINTATTSVDMAIYQLDLENVTTALLDAKNRGATVRIVTDVDDVLEETKENGSFKRLQAAGIQVVGGNSNAIMHDKFVVVDSKAVWTGSWNFTTNDTYRYNNNGILIQSPELARNYSLTFEKMWKDRKFGPQRKSGGTTPRLTIGGVTVENYFAPEDGVAEKIVNRLKEAQKSIDFMAFSFTDDQIGATIRGRASAGVKVRGVFERTGSETQFSEFPRMRSDRLDVLQDGNPYLMHHKVFIVDGRTVVTGSFNFSQNAETSNDENLLIVDEEAMAGLFTAEFERVYAQAKSPPTK